MRNEQMDEGLKDLFNLGKAKKADAVSDVARATDAARPSGWLDKWKEVFKSADTPPRVEPDFDPTKLPSIDKPKIKLQPGETQDQAIARLKAEKAAADAPAVTTATPPSVKNPSLGVDVKDYKRGFKDRVADKLTKREPGTTTVTANPQVELPKDVEVPPKMRKPKTDAEPTPTATKADEVPPATATPVGAADDVADVAKKEPGIFARNKVPTAAGIYTAGAAADAALSTGGVSNPDFPGEFMGNIGAPVNWAIDKMKGPEAATDKEGNIGVAPSSSADAPESDPTYIPPAKQQESISSILKLSGQRPITERDNTMGIIKPKAIQTLTESQIAECGMGMPTGQSASLSINATAGSGDEVANMLASIMKLAGVRPVEQDLMPKNDNGNMSMVKALQVMGGPVDEPMEPSAPDSMNSGVDYPADSGDDISVAQGDVDNDGDHDMDDHDAEGGTVTVRNVDTGEEFTGKDITTPGKITVKDATTGEEYEGREVSQEDYSNTPTDPNDVPEWDPEKMVFRPNTTGQGNRMDGTMPKGVPTMNETAQPESHVTNLFKAYEAFKNGQ